MVRTKNLSKVKRCKKNKCHNILKQWGMQCVFCEYNSIWEEKLKNKPKDLTMEQWLAGVPSKVKQLPE